MQRKVRSVRVSDELSRLDLSGLIRECERCLRDIESAAMLHQAGNREAAEALIRARQGDLGRKIGRLVLEARARRLEELRTAGQAVAAFEQSGQAGQALVEEAMAGKGLAERAAGQVAPAGKQAQAEETALAERVAAAGRVTAGHAVGTGQGIPAGNPAPAEPGGLAG